MNMTPPLTREQLEDEAALAYLATKSLREAAALCLADPETVRRRIKRYLSRNLPALPPAMRWRIENALSSPSE
jgi:hypothetical protein